MDGLVGIWLLIRGSVVSDFALEYHALSWTQLRESGSLAKRVIMSIDIMVSTFTAHLDSLLSDYRGNSPSRRKVEGD